MMTRGAAGAKVLCVDDDPYLTDLLRYALTREGYNVQVANTVKDAVMAVERELPDVALVDVQLPDDSGFSLCSRLRFDLGIPVLMLTARSSDADVITGFEQGAEDYVAKPFSMQILLLRLRSVLGRTLPRAEADKASKRTFRIGPGLFRAGHNEIVVDGTAHRLTATEGKILHLLMTHEGQLLSTEQIIEKLWGYDSETNASVVKTHIRNLRVKLQEALGGEKFVHNVPGIGYTFRQPAGIAGILSDVG